MTPDQRAVLEALTRSGLLDDDAEDLLAQVGVAGQRLEEAIIGLRTIGDSALGTRTPAELLLAQLRDLDVDDRTYAQAAALFGELSEAFIGGQDELLCAQLPCTPVELDALRRLFRTRLRPSLDLDATTSSDFLGEPVVKRNAADAAASDRRHTTSSPDAGGPVDVTFQIHGDRIEVVVSELDDLDVRIDPAWTHAMAKLSFRRSDRPTTRSLPALPSRTSSFADNERMLIIEQYDAANRLVRAVRSREQMLSLVANALAQHHGNRWMRSGAAPMTITRRAVAQTIGVHESTVSRVVQRRVAALPDGSITTLAALFDLPRSAQLTTWALLTEQPTLSDRAIAGELARQGIAVARRTVTKYRHQLRAS